MVGKVRWIVKVGIAFFLLVSMCVFANIRNHGRKLRIEKITIDKKEEVRFVTDSMVRELLDQGVMPFAETPFGEAEIRLREDVLRKHPFIDDVNVFVKPDGRTQIALEQELPVIRLNNGTEEFYLSEEIEKIPLSNAFSAKVLLATGKIQPEDYENLVHFCQLHAADNLLTKHINGIHKNSLNSFILTVNWESYIIQLGELEFLEKKLENLKIFYASSYYENYKKHLSKIDLRFLNQVVITKKESHE